MYFVRRGFTFQTHILGLIYLKNRTCARTQGSGAKQKQTPTFSHNNTYIHTAHVRTHAEFYRAYTCCVRNKKHEWFWLHCLESKLAQHAVLPFQYLCQASYCFSTCSKQSGGSQLIFKTTTISFHEFLWVVEETRNIPDRMLLLSHQWLTALQQKRVTWRVSSSGTPRTKRIIDATTGILSQLLSTLSLFTFKTKRRNTMSQCVQRGHYFWHTMPEAQTKRKCTKSRWKDATIGLLS